MVPVLMLLAHLVRKLSLSRLAPWGCAAQGVRGGAEGELAKAVAPDWVAIKDLHFT